MSYGNRLGVAAFCAAFVLGFAAAGPWPSIAAGPLDAPLSIRNSAVQVDFDRETGRMTLSDRRAQTVWNQACQAVSIPQVKSLKRMPDGRSLRAEVDTSAGPIDLVVEVQEPSEVLVRLIPSGAPRAASLVYPLPLAPPPQAELVLPVDEGALLPVTAIDVPNVLGTYQYRQSGFLMPWFGLVVGERGLMAMVETPDDLELTIVKGSVPSAKNSAPADVLLPAVSWLSCRDELRYERRVRFCLFDHGGYVAMAKRYRKYLVDAGRFRTLAEKARELPEVNKLLGAIDIHDRSQPRGPADAPGVLDWMIQGGIRRALYYCPVSPLDRQQNDKALAAGYVTARYDLYTDIATPELRAAKKQGSYRSLLGGYPDEAFVRRDGSLRTGFPYPVRGTTGGAADAGQKLQTVSSVQRCSTAKLGWLKQDVPEQSDRFAFHARFLDVETATALNECYSSSHPMTRTEDRQLRTALFNYLRSHGQIAASEGGADWPMHALHYQEGSLSLNRYSYPKGIYVGTAPFDLPEEYFAIQFNMARRVPLNKLVYHDSVLMTWRWNFTPNRWRNEGPYWDQWDLLHILYGGMPIFVVDRTNIAAKGARMLQSYRAICGVLEKTAGSEMLAHRFLTPDRQVQQTEFANGWRVTVNFALRTPYQAADGTTIEPKGFVLSKK
jgi:hypothetical protein